MNPEIDYSIPYSWRAALSNGEVVFDKNNTNTGEKSEWLKLKDYITDNSSIRIVSIQLFQTKNNPEGQEDFIGVSVPRDNAEGYFYAKRTSVSMGSRSTEDIGVGYLLGDEIRITWFDAYKFLPTNSEAREKSNGGASLLLNNQ